jgi:hypothetical protein
MDWGLADNTACIWVQMLASKKAYVYQEYVANNLDVPTHARIIKQMTGPTVMRASVMDSSAWNRDASMTSPAKRFEREGVGLSPATKDFDGTVSDMKALLSSGSIIIHKSCKNILSAMETWNYGSHEPDCLAALRYAVDSLVKMGQLMPPIPKAPKIPTLMEYISEAARNENYKRRLQHRPQPGHGLTIKLWTK